MIIENLVLTAVFVVIITMTLNHAPLFLKKLMGTVPASIMAAIVHFGYGGWLGGVTGHMLGAMLSIPLYFVFKYYLKPLWKTQCSQAWQASWFNRNIWIKVESMWNETYSTTRYYFSRNDQASAA